METYTTNRAYKFQAYPSEAYKARLDEVLELCRQLYNAALEERIDAYKKTGKSPSCYDQMKSLTKIRKEDEEYGNLSVGITRGVLFRLDEAYKGFFRRVKRSGKVGFPRFKGKHRYSTIFLADKNFFGIKSGNYKMRRLHVKGLGDMKFREHRAIEGEPVNAYITKSGTGKYYVVIICKVEKVKRQATGPAVGIDVGTKEYATLSDGAVFHNPRILNKLRDELEARDRALSLKRRGSNRRRKARIQRAKAYKRLINRRKNFQHHLANELLKKYSAISVEKLRVREMMEGDKNKGVRKRGLNRQIGDVGWSSFFTIMEYKAEEAGVSFIQINPKGTTRTCLRCGNVKAEMPLSERTYLCEKCGYSEDRDVNAARNILKIGLEARASASAVKSENSQSVEGVMLR